MTAGIRGTLVHGTALALAIDQDGPLAGVLIRGESGSGKSDLALRVLEACPWRRSRLVADDSVLVGAGEKGVMASCPAAIDGLIELRGVGISAMQRLDSVRLRAVVDLVEAAERLPEAETTTLAGAGGAALCLLRLVPFELSAPQKLRYGVRSIVAGQSAQGRQDGQSD